MHYDRHVLGLELHTMLHRCGTSAAERLQCELEGAAAGNRAHSSQSLFASAETTPHPQSQNRQKLGPGEWVAAQRAIARERVESVPQRTLHLRVPKLGRLLRKGIRQDVPSEELKLQLLELLRAQYHCSGTVVDALLRQACKHSRVISVSPWWQRDVYRVADERLEAGFWEYNSLDPSFAILGGKCHQPAEAARGNVRAEGRYQSCEFHGAR
eukprot:scaffold218437_cov28-Tisochrysis_lutea.AAC.9